MRGALLAALIAVLLAGSAVAEVSVMPSVVTQILEVGDRVVDTVDVAYESYFTAIGVQVEPGRVDTAKIVRRLAVRLGYFGS